MGKQYPKSREKFMKMPVERKHKLFDDILDFHAHTVKQGYVAIDFYDGSIMYDFNANKTFICDIEFYAKMPYTNNVGRMWGSSRFMSPEEFTLGAAIDEITNVYTMGATAFSLFAYGNRSPEAWTLNNALYEVAK
jgi:serine/threonine-protein kinase